MRYRDDMAAKDVGLNALNDAAWRDHFSRFTPLSDNLAAPLALRYHGHQFRHYNPDIGDGRGFLFAQMRDGCDRLMDLGTKGSGQTPYSRQGDGRLTLLGGIREVLATRYLEHLGVPTSRSFSLIETGEALSRHDEPSPTRSSVLVRLSHSHIRFGTFQRLAFLEQKDAMKTLVDYCCTYYFPDCDSPAELLAASAKASANMVASWMAGGFVHGVMNTDNMNITGESFDYGPYRFLPSFDPDFTAAYFDRTGLYTFGRQVETMYWNLAQLAQSLTLISEDQPLIAALETFSDHYQTAFHRHIFRRLGIKPRTLGDDRDLIAATFAYLKSVQVSWPGFWHDWQGGALNAKTAKASPRGEFYQGSLFEDWYNHLKPYESAFKLHRTGGPFASLLYDEIVDIWAPIRDDDDWSLFDAKLATFQRRELGV